MYKRKKICFCFTPRQVIGTVLLAASAVNLIIVGAAFQASAPIATPTSTATRTDLPLTRTVTVVTATEGTLIIEELTGTPTPTATFSPTDTPTFTLTSTSTPTDTPTPTATVCTPYYYWPVYVVQDGDTFYSLAIKTGSSPEELMRANCRFNTTIYKGERLYVPRLPATPTYTATATATYSDTPTTFQNPNACIDPQTRAIAFSVVAYDPEGVSVLNASYRIDRSQIQSQVQLGSNGNTYSGSESPPDQQTLYSIHYSFTATDNLGYLTTSNEFSAVLQTCYYYTVR